MSESDLLQRLRDALGDGDKTLPDSHLCRRAHELRQKAARLDDWHAAMDEVENSMPAGWAIELRMSPGDWDISLLDRDHKDVPFDRGSDTMAQAIRSAIETARSMEGGQG